MAKVLRSEFLGEKLCTFQEMGFSKKDSNLAFLQKDSGKLLFHFWGSNCISTPYINHNDLNVTSLSLFFKLYIMEVSLSSG